MANGIIIVDKPADWTSQDVAAKLRGVFHERRIGHGGTLDPMATGVLPIFVGRATRAVPYFESAEKEYIATLHLGLETDTQDITGTCLRTAPVAVTQAELEHVLSQFLGPQQQLPPMYSAVKIGGKKLYELARQGKTVERAPRQIEVFALELLGGQGADWRLRVHCSMGHISAPFARISARPSAAAAAWRPSGGQRPAPSRWTRPSHWRTSSQTRTPLRVCWASIPSLPSIPPSR